MTRAAGRSGESTRFAAAVLIVAALATVGALVVWNPSLAHDLSRESGVLETAQVMLCGACGLIALSSARALIRAGRPVVLDAVIVAAMTALVIGEIDLDRQLFGVKVIHTRFFVNASVPPGLRALAALVVVGVPLVFSVWALRRWRSLWHDAVVALREPWGQVFAGGTVIFAIAEIFEKSLARAVFAPRNSLEETLELAASIAFFLGAVARRRALGREPS